MGSGELSSFLEFFLCELGQNFFVLDVNAQSAIQAHPLIGNPRDYEERYYPSTPIINQESKARQD